MARSGNFQRNIGPTGVPNIVQQGVSDTSTADLVNVVGSAAIEANRGFHEGKLEKQLETDIDRLETEPRNDTATTPNLFVNVEGAGPPLEMSFETATEREVQGQAKSLKAARESGSLTHGEFMSRAQALTRRAISQLPGRAGTFRKILSDTLGDHEDRIAPAKAAAAARAKQAAAANKAQAKLENDALQIGVSTKTMQEINFANATRALQNQETGIAAGTFYANESANLQMNMDGMLKQLQTGKGSLFLDPGEVIVMQQAYKEQGDLAKIRISEKANEEGWTFAEVKQQHAQIDAMVNAEKESLAEVNGSSFLEQQAKYQSALTNNEILFRNKNVHWMINNAPWLMQQAVKGAEWWQSNAGHLDPSNPNHAAELEKKQGLFNSQFGFIDKSGLLPENWQSGGLGISEQANANLERMKKLGFPVEMNKAAASAVVKSAPTTEMERDSMLEAVRKLGDSSDGDGMSPAAYADPQTVARITQDNDAKRILKTQAANAVAALVRNYEFDSKTVRDVGTTQKLPFGPAYDMKFADATVRANAPNAADIFVGKGVGSVSIGPTEVNENYRAGVEMWGRVVEAYKGTDVFGGKSGQEWMSETISSALGTTEETKGANAVRNPFQMLKDFLNKSLPGTEQEEAPVRPPAATGIIDRTTAQEIEQDKPAPDNTLQGDPVVEAEINRAAPILDLIGSKESLGNYNAHYGKPEQEDIRFTEMTVNEIIAWQNGFLGSGSPSSAVGKYQIIRDTLKSLRKPMKLKGTEVFNEQLQDEMAVTLMKRRGYDRFKDGKITREQFANNLAKEWASFPVTTGDKKGLSFYDGDGLNKALISPEEVLNALSADNVNIEKFAPGTYLIDGELTVIS